MVIGLALDLVQIKFSRCGFKTMYTSAHSQLFALGSISHACLTNHVNSCSIRACLNWATNVYVCKWMKNSTLIERWPQLPLNVNQG